MSKQDKDQNKPESQQEEAAEEVAQEPEQTQTPEEAAQAAIREQEDKYLRLDLRQGGNSQGIPARLRQS